MIEVKHILRRYLDEFAEEGRRLHQFSDFLGECHPAQFFDRKNFVGHITASALIVDPDRSRLLMIHHKTIDRWLQPGGHVEPADESVLAGALREAREEVGIGSGELTLISGHSGEEVPLDIDTHYIARNEAEDEKEHFHHDFRYLFAYRGDRKVSFDQDEVKGCRWVEFAELDQDLTFGPLLVKIRRVLAEE